MIYQSYINSLNSANETEVNCSKELISGLQNELNGFYDKDEARHLIKTVFCEILGLSSYNLVISDDRLISDTENCQFKNAVKQLKKYRPIQYIFGKLIFMDYLLCLMNLYSFRGRKPKNWWG